MTEFSSSILSWIMFLLCLFGSIISCRCSNEERNVYIVYMGGLDEIAKPSSLSLSANHVNMLEEVVDPRFLEKSLIRSYTRSFNGFAANLTHEEQKKLASHGKVVSIFPSTTLYTQTTNSWDFMGFRKDIARNPSIESDIIIGVIDGGIWPESESFSDKGFGPPPKKWKGEYKGGHNFTCNNKIIGARNYVETSDSARDVDGHGSHTASIAAGNSVKGASFYGIAEGDARGGVPSARIAAYKVCDLGCRSVNILAGFDDAIADGVDLITISIGPFLALKFEEDVISLAAFHATQKGILVVQAVGNRGAEGLVVSVVPWIFAVAASSTDRGIISKVVLGNGTVLNGKSVNSFHLNRTSYPFLFGKEISTKCTKAAAEACEERCLGGAKINNSILLCSSYSGIRPAFHAKTLGTVSPPSYMPNAALVVPFSASNLNSKDFNVAKEYKLKTKDATVDILPSELIKNLDAPVVASFSSRGPNTIYPNILKPDVTAPGIEILAAYSPLSSPSNNNEDKRSVQYSIVSGTSMACPHVTGQLLRESVHPKWSPSAIKSAIMTSAWRMNSTRNPLFEFAYGSGHIDPVKAIHRGLVYEASSDDYIKFLCESGYDAKTLGMILGQAVTCEEEGAEKSPNLNYPSMTFYVSSDESKESVPFSAEFVRTVTNVGSANSTYKAVISEGSDYKILVSPKILEFGALNEKKSFKVEITGNIKGGKMVSASLEWSDGAHNVRSPIVVYTGEIDA